MNVHVSSDQLGIRDIEQPKRRGIRFTLNGVLWVLQALFGFFFAGSGFGKVLMYDAALYAAAPQAVAWYAAVSQPLIVFIGICEVLGGVGLLLPAMTKVKPVLTPLAAAGLALTMILAAAFHIVRGEYALVPANLVLGGATAFITAGRWKLRPVAPGSVTTARMVGSFAVLIGIVLLTFLPTWYTMTSGQF
ncbi:DoxX family protein [Nonomuraea fuscirosea]|uniref:DoxX family protein n=1 Tax=Nonomuraea fuscirosea TaxID=1291556 RepID=UPI0033E81D68